MPGHVYRVIEVVGTSPSGLDSAIEAAIARANVSLRGIDWFEVSEIRGHIRDGAVAHYQVSLKIGFHLED